MSLTVVGANRIDIDFADRGHLTNRRNIIPASDVHDNRFSGARIDDGGDVVPASGVNHQ